METLYIFFFYLKAKQDIFKAPIGGINGLDVIKIAKIKYLHNFVINFKVMP